MIQIIQPVGTSSWMENRNGIPEVKAIELTSLGDEVEIGGIGQRKLRGGIRIVGLENMDKLATHWLAERAEHDCAVVAVMPQEVWVILEETLRLDSRSGAFTSDLRAQISNALSQVTTHYVD